MKTCPICNCVAFDDARTCFGCLHPFDEGLEPSAPESENRTGNAPVRFVVSFTPTLESGRTVWSCSVEPSKG